MAMTCFCVVKFVKCHNPLSKGEGDHGDKKDGANGSVLFSPESVPHLPFSHVIINKRQDICVFHILYPVSEGSGIQPSPDL